MKITDLNEIVLASLDPDDLKKKKSPYQDWLKESRAIKARKAHGYQYLLAKYKKEHKDECRFLGLL